MFRVSIKIERLPMAVSRRTLPTEETTPELLIQAKDNTILGAIMKAIRILTGEQTALMEAMPIKGKLADIDEDEEDEI